MVVKHVVLALFYGKANYTQILRIPGVRLLLHIEAWIWKKRIRNLFLSYTDCASTNTKVMVGRSKARGHGSSSSIDNPKARPSSNSRTYLIRDMKNCPNTTILTPELAAVIVASVWCQVEKAHVQPITSIMPPGHATVFAPEIEILTLLLYHPFTHAQASRRSSATASRRPPSCMHTPLPYLQDQGISISTKAITI